MSDLIINIRVGLYHFQVKENWRISILRNGVHKGYPDGYIWVYEFFGWTQTKYGFVKYNKN